MNRILTLLVFLLASAEAPQAVLAQKLQPQTLDAVRTQCAHQIYEAARKDINFDAPQPLLRAVVVIRLRLAEDGRWMAEVLRDNPEQPEMTRKALDSVNLLPAPQGLSAETDAELHWKGFVEAWLFQNDGRFALKTLAKEQRGI